MKKTLISTFGIRKFQTQTRVNCCQYCNYLFCFRHCVFLQKLILYFTISDGAAREGPKDPRVQAQGFWQRREILHNQHQGKLDTFSHE